MDCLKEYSKYIEEKQLVVIRSSVYPGICSQINKILGHDINLSFCPERIVQGFAIKELSDLPQIISGFSYKV